MAQIELPPNLQFNCKHNFSIAKLANTKFAAMDDIKPHNVTLSVNCLNPINNPTACYCSMKFRLKPRPEPPGLSINGANWWMDPEPCTVHSSPKDPNAHSFKQKVSQ